MITHHMDQNRKKEEIGANYKGYWIEGVERKFLLKFVIFKTPPPTSFSPSKNFKQTAIFLHC